jgi:uncharacterized protein YcbX
MSARLAAIGRYPIKSMLGESPSSAVVEERGIVGDRALALVETESGKVVSAKDPRRWAAVLGFRARFADAAVTITFPDGTERAVGDPQLGERLSAALGREVTVQSVAPEGAAYDAVWDVAGVLPDDLIESSKTDVTDAGAPVTTMPLGMLAPGTFQDVAPITLMTTASLRRMAQLAPTSTWDPARFRSNLLIDVDAVGFVEDEWVGRHVTIGEVELAIAMAAPRCVMTTLEQQGLARDRGVLQAVATHHRLDLGGGSEYACLGVYASVVGGGTVSVGDPVDVS